jgi:hypothetical protein
MSAAGQATAGSKSNDDVWERQLPSGRGQTRLDAEFGLKLGPSLGLGILRHQSIHSTTTRCNNNNTTGRDDQCAGDGTIRRALGAIRR